MFCFLLGVIEEGPFERTQRNRKNSILKLQKKIGTRGCKTQKIKWKEIKLNKVG